MSADTMCRPSKPRKISRISRVDQPPISGVPVAGANLGILYSTRASWVLYSEDVRGVDRVYVNLSFRWL
jgi:hypothetical protein